MVKKFLIALALAWGLGAPLLANEQLIQLISNKRWSELPSLFGDATYKSLEVYFKEATAMHLQSVNKNELLYKAKFKEYAEIGSIMYSVDNQRLVKLSIGKQVKPLYFFQSFKKFTVENLSLRLGDAEILFQKGSLYEPFPAPAPLLFLGDWQFRIKPGDEEERLTLVRLFKSDTFVKAGTQGVFILQDKSFLNSANILGETVNPDLLELAPLLAIHRQYFGIEVPEFKEQWHLAPTDRDNLIIFEKDKKSNYIYNFNDQQSPDTQLRTTADDKIILSYNALKEIKLSLKKLDQLQEMNLFLFLHPEKNSLYGTSTLTFRSSASSRTLNLNPQLKIRDSSASESRSMNLIQKNDLYYIISPETDKMAFFYSGSIAGDESYPDLVRIEFRDNLERYIDEFTFLSRNQNFYPNPGAEFFKSRVKISLPAHLNCLASGSLVESETIHERTSFTYQSEGTKGLSLICGPFKKVLHVASQTPIQVFCAKDYHLQALISEAEIKEMADLLTGYYGRLPLPEINVLIRRWRQDGGISNTGFVIFNIMEATISIMDTTMRVIRRDTPVVLSGNRRDFLMHELAHQWWGGLVSWASYRDEWLTEGLAHYSTLLYLRQTLSAGRFQNILERQNKWVLKYADAGPIIYGKRIANIDEYEAFQAVIYDKAALVMLMLEDLLGREELSRRLRTFLENNRYTSVTSREFINQLSQKEPRLLKFFDRWIYSRLLPNVSYSVKISGNEADLTILQNGSAFVFPLTVLLSTDGGEVQRSIVVEEASQHYHFTETAAVRLVKLAADHVPLQLHKE